MPVHPDQTPNGTQGASPAAPATGDGHSSWNPVAQASTAVLLAVGLVLLAWRGWSVSRFSTQPLTLQRAERQGLVGSPIKGTRPRSNPVRNSDDSSPIAREDRFATGEEERLLSRGQSESFRRLQQRLKDDNDGSASPRPASSGMVNPYATRKKVPSGVVNMNRATREELQGLPGIGPTLAQRIVEARPFRSVDDLRRVRGIGPKTLERLRPLVGVEDPASIRVTASGKE